VHNANDLQVYEGWSTSGPVLLHASGNSIPARITTTSRSLVHLHSDSSVTGKGFRANFDVSISPPDFCSDGVIYEGLTLNVSVANGHHGYWCLNSRRESIFLSFESLIAGYGIFQVIIS
jgi:hypothetical protein